MKKILVSIAAISLVMALAIPALADTNVNFSGEYRIRGFYNDNPTLTKNGDDASAAWLDHRFRLQTVFAANDNVSVTTRMDIFDDQPFGTENILVDKDSGNDNSDINVDAVYLTALTPIGLFKAGRIPGGSTFGTNLGNTGVDFAFDRIEYFMKTGDFVGGLIYEKLAEDNTLPGNYEEDCDTYYMIGKYQQENLETGVALRFQDVDTLSDLTAVAPELSSALATNVVLAPSLASIALYEKIKNYALAPYVKASFGAFGVEAEVIYETGQYEVGNSGKMMGYDDRDIDAWTYKLEGSLDLDMASFNLGWASCTGESLSDLQKMDGDMTVGNVIYRGLGDDFEPLLILTGDAGGKPLNNGTTTLLTGVDLLYAGGSFAISDAVTLRGALGQAWAQEDDYTGGDDDFGWEIDLGLDWNIMDNLTYTASVGYLDKGDEILKGTTISLPGTGDDTYACYNEVKVTF